MRVHQACICIKYMQRLRGHLVTRARGADCDGEQGELRGRAPAPGGGQGRGARGADRYPDQAARAGAAAVQGGPPAGHRQDRRGAARARTRLCLTGRAQGPQARVCSHAHCLAALPRGLVCYALGRRPSRGAHVGLLAAGLVDDGRVDALAAPAPEPLAHQCASAPLCQPQTACAQGTDPTLCT